MKNKGESLYFFYFFFKKGIDKISVMPYNVVTANEQHRPTKGSKTMIALAIIGILTAAYLLTAGVTFIVRENLPMNKTPEWLEKLYNVLTFNWR